MDDTLQNTHTTHKDSIYLMEASCSNGIVKTELEHRRSHFEESGESYLILRADSIAVISNSSYVAAISLGLPVHLTTSALSLPALAQ